MKKLERNKGITLIALVITIIVLLIITGISIIMLSRRKSELLTTLLNREKIQKKLGLRKK